MSDRPKFSPCKHVNQEWRCLDCNTPVCTECMHSHLSKTLSHRVCPSLCYYHSDNSDFKAESFCKDCQVYLCDICCCKLNKHDKHDTVHLRVAGKHNQTLDEEIDDISEYRQDKAKEYWSKHKEKKKRQYDNDFYDNCDYQIPEPFKDKVIFFLLGCIGILSVIVLDKLTN